MDTTNINTLFKHRKEIELTPRQKACVEFWETCLNTDLNANDYFEIADMIENVLGGKDI